MKIIPNSDFPAYFESVVLNNTPYTFGFIWNTRDNAWSMSIDRDGKALLSSVKIVDNFALTDLYVDQLLPSGEILSIDLQGIKKNPNRDELGTAVKIAHFTLQDIIDAAI